MTDEERDLGPLAEPTWEIHVSEFAEFMRLIETESFKRLYGRGWSFRGQADSHWDLSSGLARFIQRSGISKKAALLIEIGAIAKFQMDVATLAGDSCPDFDDIASWLSFMQHHGVPTRALDWTTSPEVAAFFAFESEHSSDRCAIWFLNTGACHYAFPFGSYTSAISGRDSRESRSVMAEVMQHTIRFPLPVFPTLGTSRSFRQKACFTIQAELEFPLCGLSRDPGLLREGWKMSLAGKTMVFPNPANDLQLQLMHGQLHAHQLIRKVTLPRSERKNALEALSNLGITRSSLFPAGDNSHLDQIGAETCEQAHSLSVHLS